MKKMKCRLIWMAVWLMGFCVLPQKIAGIGATEPGEQGKKLHFEVSVGAGGINPRPFYNRMTGITDLVSQYTGIYDGSYTSGGEFVEDKLLLPFRASVLYDMTPEWKLLAGLEYGFASAASQKDFQLKVVGTTDNQVYDVDYKISYLMPQVGIGYRISKRFEVNGRLGLGLGSLTYNEAFSSSVSGGTNSRSTWAFSTTDLAPAAILGCEYRIPLQKGMIDKMGFTVKLEMLLLKFGSFEGIKTVSYEGSTRTNETEGTLYHYQWDLYDQGGFDYWDLFTKEPQGDQYDDVQPLGLNMSGVRLLVGFYF